MRMSRNIDSGNSALKSDNEIPQLKTELQKANDINLEVVDLLRKLVLEVYNVSAKLNGKHEIL